MQRLLEKTGIPNSNPCNPPNSDPGPIQPPLQRLNLPLQTSWSPRKLAKSGTSQTQPAHLQNRPEPYPAPGNTGRNCDPKSELLPKDQGKHSDCVWPQLTSWIVGCSFHQFISSHYASNCHFPVECKHEDMGEFRTASAAL